MSATTHTMQSRLPDLPEPITTAWVTGGHKIFVTTPLDPWHAYEIPDAVFAHPEEWIDG